MPANEAPLLSVRDLVHEFHTKGGVVQAVSGVSFDVRPGETLGVVGETGSGKSTLARCVLQAPRPTSGSVLFRGTDLTALHGTALLAARRHLQMVFQDPFGSLDPKWAVRDLVSEPLVAYRAGGRAARRQRVDEVLELVGLDPAGHGRRRPRELSGGQAQVLNLFERLRTELSLSYLFIAHDLALVKQVSDRVAVMYLGKLCEVGPGEAVYREPLHPYTRALLDSVPSTEPKDPTAQRATTTISGEPPSPIHPPSGCRFRTRCPRAAELCAVEQPPMRELATGHAVACHFPLASQTAARTTARSEKIGETPR